MKKYCLTSLFLLLACFVVAQDKLSKAEKKALQAEIKAYQKDPAKYKEFKQSIQTKKEHIAKLDGQISELNEAINTGKTQLTQKEERVKQLVDEINRLKTEKGETEKIVKNTINEEGVFYKVQVPIEEAALYKEVSEVDGKTKPVFSGDQDEDGAKKYTLGYFKDKPEADTFCQYLRLLRIKDAVVVKYENGKLSAFPPPFFPHSFLSLYENPPYRLCACTCLACLSTADSFERRKKTTFTRNKQPIERFGRLCQTKKRIG
jgi:hypothetical protein